MLKRKLEIFFLICCFIFASTPVALCVTSTPIIYVSGDGTGDFNCDGKDDHVQINQALAFVAENSGYTTVYLKGPFTYIIDDTLLIGNNTILEGDSSAKIKLVSNAGWAAWKPMIKERSSGSSDITIRSFTIDGNREGNTNVVSGKGYYNLIHLSSCQNINIYNMYLTNNHGDGLKTDKCTGVKLYNNKIYLLGHDGLYASSCSDVEAYNNTITCRTNSALRLYDTNKASFHDNVITSEGSGGAGIEIQKYNNPLMDDIEVYNNIIYKTALAGIWIFGSGSYSTSSANVHVHHNQIYDTGTRSSNSIIGGIVSNGFSGLIENNVIDGAYGAGIVQKSVYSPAPSGSGFVLTVKDNIITNTRSGPGISNTLTSTHSFSVQNNCFYGNTGGNYDNVQASSSIEADPQYVDRDNHDYNLKSTSPAIGIGVYAGTSTVSSSQTTVDETTTETAETEVIAEAGEVEVATTNNQTIVNDTTVINTNVTETAVTETASEQVVGIDNTSLIEENATGIVIDNRLREASPDTVYQEKAYIDIGGRPGVGKYRDLLLFDLSEYSDAENISSATLSLYWYYPDGRERPEDAIVEIYRPAATWNPENVTWNSRDADVLWAQPGGDWFDMNNVSQGDAPYATITLKGSDIPDNRYYELNVTDLVKEYAGGEYENTGFLIKTRTENADYVAFCSNEGNQRPGLNITRKVAENTAENTAENVTITGATDNRLCECSSKDVFQNKEFIDVGGTSTGGRYRDVMWFNLSEYTDSTDVSNVSLSLYWYYPESVRSEDTVIEIYRPASAWDSSYVSWNKKDECDSWNNAGGDWYDKNGVSQGDAPYATITLKGSDLPDNRYYELNVTDLVREYISGKYENTGFFIKARSESNNYVAFYSADRKDENQQPQLRIVYV